MSRRQSKKATAAEKAKGRVTERAQSSQAALENPWPRDDGVPFNLHWLGRALNEPNLTAAEITAKCKYPRELGEPWNEYNAILYNRWLRVTFRPTPVICEDSLEKMGIKTEVLEMLARMGLGTLPFTPYRVYRELAVQFFSSVRVHLTDGGAAWDATQYFIAFMIRGKEYRLPIPQLCTLFGFDPTATELYFPTSQDSYQVKLWNHIGTETTIPREFKIARIRNPVLRVVAKIIGTIFFGREEAGSCLLGDCSLLHYGLPPSALGFYPPGTLDDVSPSLRVNLGYQLAEIFFLRRTKGLTVTSRGKDDYMGGLVTPIFRAVGIDLRREESSRDTRYFDLAYFRSCKIIKASDPRLYEFSDREDRVRLVRLPVPGFTTPDSPAALAFEIPPEFLITPSGRGRRTHASRRPMPPGPPPVPSYTPSSFPDPSEIMGGDFSWEEIPFGTPEEFPTYCRNVRGHMSRMERFARWMICGGRSGSAHRSSPGRGQTSRAAAAADAHADDMEADDGVAQDAYDAGAPDAAVEEDFGGEDGAALVPYDPLIAAQAPGLEFTYHRRRRAPGDTHSVSTDGSA